MHKLLIVALSISIAALVAACGGSSSGNAQVNLLPSEGDGGSLANTQPKTPKVLFVGDSFTYGRRDPAKSYNAAGVSDLTLAFNLIKPLGEPSETHPWGGVPGIFQKMVSLAGLTYSVSMSARPATTLREHYLNPSDAGWDLRSNLAKDKWDVVVLQDQSDDPLQSYSSFSKYAVDIASYIMKGTGNSTLQIPDNSNSNRNARIYLYQTWAKPESVRPTGTDYANFTAMSKDLHAVFDKLYKDNSANIHGVAPVGDAFQLLIDRNLVNTSYLVSPDDVSPGCSGSLKLGLWFTDKMHASPQGSYLAALVVFGRVTGVSPMSLDGKDQEIAAAMCLSDSDAKNLKQAALDALVADTLRRSP